eukprot:jgi/Astpho2/4100/Aster-x0188
MLEDKDQEPQQTRDLLYLSALCQYRLGNYMTARSQIQELLKVHPHSRQAKDLLKIVEDQMVKEGLIGMGIGAAVLTGAGIIIGGLLMGRKR